MAKKQMPNRQAQKGAVFGAKKKNAGKRLERGEGQQMQRKKADAGAQGSLKTQKNKMQMQQTRAQQQNKAMRQAPRHQTARPQQAYAEPAPQKRVRRFYDYSLLFAIILVFVFGLLMIYSSSQYTAMIKRGNANYYFQRQLAIGVGGLILAVLFSKLVDYRWLKPLAMPGILLAIALLLATMLMGIASHGKTRWLSIAGISFQPTEPAKLAIIVFLAAMISKLGYRVSKPRNIITLCIWAAVPGFLILIENLSSGIIVAGITFVMLFVACRQWKVFSGLAALGVSAVLLAKPAAAAIITKFDLPRPEQYQLRRIFGWALPERFPDDAYQTLQGMYAIGSGGITGQGLGESIQKFGKLPEAQNDMIFAIICEELGLVGAAAIVILFVFIIYRLMQIAANAEDLFGSMICVGIIAHLSIQVILNIAVVTGVIPNTGVTLPFISYGGTAVLFTMLEIGLALSVANQIRLE